jgi:tRNA/rRNA methyltransferase/tRNA (cytidine32/uridine32-2'-O)-methyltransferase
MDPMNETSEALLAQIRVVLVQTSHPGNIGAAARAMKTMGLTQLYLVAPSDFPSAEATARASGADDLLARAVVCERLEQALEGCLLVLGTSARRRALQWPELSAREAAPLALDKAGAGPVALVFGRERSGLTNEELDRCRYLVHIPSNPDYNSLNLGSAVQVLAYELRASLPDGKPPVRPEPGEEPAPADALEDLYGHLEVTLAEIGFLDPDNPRHLMRRLRRLFNRAELSRNEVQILRGILSGVQGPRRPPD